MAAGQHTTRKPRPFKPCLACGSPIQGKPSHIPRKTFCSKECCKAYQKGPGNPNWKGGMVRIPCAHCGTSVEVFPGRASKPSTVHCSRKCLGAAQSGGVSHTREKQREYKQRYLAKQRELSGPPKREPRKKPASFKQLRLPFPGFTKSRVSPPQSRRCSPHLCPHCGLAGVPKGRKFHADCSPYTGDKLRLITCQDCGLQRHGYLKGDKDRPRCRSCSFKSRRGEGNSNWKGGITPENQRLRRSEQYRQWRIAVFERDAYTCTWCGQKGGKLNADHIKPFAYFPELRFDLNNGRTLCVPCHKKTDTFMSKAKRFGK